MEERRGGGAVEKSGTHLPRRAPTDVVGARGRGRTLLSRKEGTQEGAGGHDRSRKAAPPGTWYLTTNLPAPGSHERQTPSDLALASIQEVVRLYGLRMWVEQSYKQVKH